MDENEMNYFEGSSSLLGEDVQSAIIEFESLYGEADTEESSIQELVEEELATDESVLSNVDGSTELDMDASFDENLYAEDAMQMEHVSQDKAGNDLDETPYVQNDIKPTKKKDKKKGSAVVTVFAVILLIAGVSGVGFLVKKVLDTPVKEKEEITEEVFTEITTEEITEATTEDEKAKWADRWFIEKTVCVPEMTVNTKSLPAADLSVFELAKQQEESEEEIPEEEKIDPWQLVTINLESVPGSINLTSPGEADKTTQLTSTYMVLVDVDTNEIIAERECEKQIVPASMTKILTVLTARDYIDETKLDDTFTITAEMVNEAQASGLSAVGFLPGDTVTVRDLLYGTIVCSGADAAMGLAQYCAGSQEVFVERMNENVEALGLSDTAHFTNVVGKYDEALYCTMTDMASILSVAIQDDLLRDVLSKRIYHTDIKYPDLDMPDGMEISNWFLRRIEDKEMNGNVIGAKTGFVNQSGFCCASYYEANNGKRYICVTGNASNTWRAIYDHVGVYRSLTE